MILTCPSCSTRYLADPASLQPAGRMVRCANCGHSWFQKPPDDMPRSVTGGGTEGIAALEAGQLGGRRRGLASSFPTLALWLVLAGALAGLGYFAYQYRVDIVRGWPQSATLYNLFGVEVNSAGMEFRDITYAFETQEGLNILAVRGAVVNVTDQALPIPRVRISLRDEAGEELYAWTVVLEDTRLDPGATTQFVTRLSSPPPGAANIEVTFAEGGP